MVVGTSELFEYDEIMFRFVGLAYHIVNNDFVQALADFGYSAMECPMPIVLWIQDCNFKAVAKMVQMGATLNSPIIWTVLIEAPVGEGNCKFSYIDCFLQNGFMNADDDILGKGWIDFALKAKKMF